MTTYIIAYITTAAIFLLIDFIWLGFIAGPYYKKELGDLMLENPKLGIAAVFYLFYAVGVVVFAVVPALQADSYLTALGYGALLGLCAYGTYDATNLATLKGWPWHISVMDAAWGTVVTGGSATLGYFATKFILPYVS